MSRVELGGGGVLKLAMVKSLMFKYILDIMQIPKFNLYTHETNLTQKKLLLKSFLQTSVKLCLIQTKSSPITTFGT